MMTGSVAVSVVLLALHAWMKFSDTVFERARERKWLRAGIQIFSPDQRFSGICCAPAGGTAKGRACSRVGRRFVLGGTTIVLLKTGHGTLIAARRSLWKATPDAPSPRA